jgi:hypothetical protein
MASKAERKAPQGYRTPPRHTAKSCVHENYKQWAGRCEGCLVSPLSPRIKYLEEKYNREG